MPPDCLGLGARKETDDRLLISVSAYNFRRRNCAAFGKPRTNWTFTVLKQAIESWGFDFDTPMKKFSKEQMEIILNGDKEKRDYKYVGFTRNTKGIFP